MVPALRHGKQPEVRAPFRCVGRLAAQRYQPPDNKTALAWRETHRRALLGPVVLGFRVQHSDPHAKIAQRFLGDK
jgi:hypothetical protein